MRIPTPQQLRDYAQRHHISLSEQAATELLPYVSRLLLNYDVIDELPETTPELLYAERPSGHRPSSEEDPYNAFTWLCTIRGADTGPLAGVRVAVKDCISVAGVPMTNGSRMLPQITPTEDAVVVERLLSSGATIVGKTNMEDLGMGLGEGTPYGAARNPIDPRYSTGGSSSGSAAAVAAGQADIGLAADQAGSIRIPAAWSGLVGMKASQGLVPSYGLTHMDHTLDHIGPITRRVRDNAVALGCIAGPDWRDPQWVRDEPSASGRDYVSELGRGVDGMTLAVIEESLTANGCTEDVLDSFESSCDALRRSGAKVEMVSIPLWDVAVAIHNAVMNFGLLGMRSSGGMGYGHLGRMNVAIMQGTMTQALLSADDLPPQMKLRLLVAEHIRDQYLGIHFAKAQNLRLELRRQVSEVLASFDALLTPTTPTTSFELQDDRAGITEMLDRQVALSRTILNTCPLDLTGHPALTVPGGSDSRGLPLGLQVIGSRWAEARLYRIGETMEQVMPSVLNEWLLSQSNDAGREYWPHTPGDDAEGAETEPG